jgi:hypothetical protein
MPLKTYIALLRCISASGSFTFDERKKVEVSE